MAVIPPGAGNWSALKQALLGPQLRDVYLIKGSPESPFLAATSNIFSRLESQTLAIYFLRGRSYSPLSWKQASCLFGQVWASSRLLIILHMSLYGAHGKPGPSAQDKSSSQTVVLNRPQLAWVSVVDLNGSVRKARACSKPKKNVLLVEASFPNPEASLASQRVLLLLGDLFLS